VRAGLWDCDTRARTVELRIPELRKVSRLPGFLKPRPLTEKALTAPIQEVYVQASRHARSLIWSS